MTWTLRFYDEDGVEIGYVEKPDRETYNVYVTHPESGWDDFKRGVETYSTLLEDEDDYNMKAPGMTADHGPMEMQREPEEHLRVVQERFYYPGVEEMTLNDK
jgi:hypothetical protein